MVRRALAAAACIAVALTSACEGDLRGPVAGPELWRARPPAARRVEHLLATGDGAVLAGTLDDDDGSWVERVDATGWIWSVPVEGRREGRTYFASVADGGALIVASVEVMLDGEPGVVYRVQRIAADGRVTSDRVLARATTTNTVLDAVVVAPEGIYVLLRVGIEGTLDIGGTVLRDDGVETCYDTDAGVCGLMVLAHLDVDGDLQWAGQVTLRVETFKVVLVPGYLLVGGGEASSTVIAAIRVPPGAESTLSPAWTIEAGSDERLFIQLLTADATGHIYAARSHLLAGGVSPSEELVRYNPDRVEQWSERISESTQVTVPASGGVTALGREYIQGLDSRGFLIAVDESGRFVGREASEADSLVSDSTGRLFYDEKDEIVARDPLP